MDRRLTSLNVFRNCLFLLAGSCLLGGLSLEFAALVVGAPSIQGSLQGVALPAEDIVSVPSVSDTDNRLSK